MFKSFNLLKGNIQVCISGILHYWFALAGISMKWNIWEICLPGESEDTHRDEHH